MLFGRYKKFARELKGLIEAFKILKVEVYYLRKYVEWLEKKYKVKCTHKHLDYWYDDNGDRQWVCKKCGLLCKDHNWSYNINK